MTISLWAASTFHPGFRCGGWASVRSVGGVASGYAGGERGTTATRIALAGLVAALRDLPAGMAVAVHTTGSELNILPDILAGRLQPETDLDLWAGIAAAAKKGPITLVRATPTKDSPTTFAAAWADLAMDKAKMGGAFSAAIPKGNLSKVAGL